MPAVTSRIGVPTQPTVLCNVLPPADDPERIQLHMHIPTKLVCSIFGKGGSIIEQTEATSGAMCSFTARDNGDQQVVIIGTYFETTAAQKGIWNQMVLAVKDMGSDPHTEVKATVVLFIRKEAVGAVLGKQGAQLNSIQEQSQTTIQMERCEIFRQRPISITGSFQSVLLAEELISDIVKSVPVVSIVSSAKRKESQLAPGCWDGAQEIHVSDEDDCTAYRINGICKAQFSPEDGPEPKRARTRSCHIAVGQTKILMPSRLFGAMIGNQGSDLRFLREMYSVRIQILQQHETPLWPSDRVVTVFGDLRSRVAAVSAMLANAFDQNTDDVMLSLLVPAAVAGTVVGNYIKSLGEEAGVKMELEQVDIQGERLMTAQGARKDISMVLQMVSELLDGHVLLHMLATTFHRQ